MSELFVHALGLRGRCRGLRAHSRELMARSADLRRRIFGREAQEPPPPEPVPTAAPTRLERLLRSEHELELAIEECRAALVEVRREISGSAGRAAQIVH
jgi:hypothetical protein